MKKNINVSPTDITIQMKGETGTGRGLAAKVIHALSSKRGQPFIPINHVFSDDGSTVR